VGITDINVYSFQYKGSSGQTSLNFANGLTGWGLEATGTVSVQPESDANGTSIHISATSAEETFINSSSIAVVPGDNYNLTIRARVPPSSIGSGSFSLVFLNAGGTEVSRATLNFAPPTLTLGSAQTAIDGTYSITYAPLGPGDFQSQAAYPGSSAFWPAFASGPLFTTPFVPSNGIVSAADLTVEPLTPGSWFTIFGQNLGNAAQWTNPSTLTLGGAGITVCGTPATISYNSGPVVGNFATSWQVNALTPESVAGQTSCPVVVTVNGQASPPVTVSIGSGILELFTFASSGGSLPVITHSDYSLVGPGSAGLTPAKPGETVIAWGTGNCVSPAITVDGASAPVLYSGMVEAGLCQVNFQVASQARGQSQLRLSTSPNTYTLAVTP
jgi:uncharacterized protein (TIGR03437 family)